MAKASATIRSSHSYDANLCAWGLRMPKFRLTLLAVAVICWSGTETTAQTYPSRPITLIVPFVPGGGVDTLGRILAYRMKATLGQPIVIENIPTAAGTVGVGRLAQAAPDGYTIIIGDQTSHVISSIVSPVRYDVLTDFDPISLLSTSAATLVARRTMQASDLKQLIVWLRENPEGATVASFGQGSGPYIVGTTFQRLTGTKFRMVTYRGNAAAIPDLISNQIDLMFVEQSIVIPHLSAGAIKAYAILAKSRSVALPEVPTIEEAGGPPLHVVTWRGMWVPKGTPSHITSRLGSAVVERPSCSKANCRRWPGDRAARPADSAGACRAS
jgi:tripartite-type tricarboxylate transporter receptor subunit TctC